jgi:GNAT superfamily N-acetyltransferase
VIFHRYKPRISTYHTEPLSSCPTTGKLAIVMLREWDPMTASAAELESWLRTQNAAIAADLPGDPRWQAASLREYLSVTMPGERCLMWHAAHPDRPDQVGFARLLLHGGLGVLELHVPPAVRRHGLGRALLAVVAARARAEGFPSLGVEVVGGTPGGPFFEANGFQRAYTEMRSLLDLSTVDNTALDQAAAAVATGYQVRYHPGGLPDELLPGYAEAKQVRRLDPPGDLELRPSSYDPDRLRASIACLTTRGLRPHFVVAIHERTGRVAALTELVVPAQHPSRADQYDTTVVPEFNSYGLGRAIKARMLVEIRRDHPQLAEVQTWHPTANHELQHLNEELGFKPDRQWHEYEADAAELEERLRPG